MRKSIAPWAALAGSLALTLAAAAFLFTTGRMRERTRFARATYVVRERIVARLDASAALLRGTASLIAAHPDTSPEQFRSYVTGLDLARHQPGLQGIGFVRSFSRAQASEVEAELHERGFLGLRVWPDSGREARSAILWIEPLDRRNRAALGYDMLTDRTRREAMERARDERREALSAKVPLVQEIDANRQAGFLLFFPVYRAARGRDVFVGWTHAAFRADDLFRALVAEEPDPLVDFQVYDGPRALKDTLLHDREVEPQPGAAQETDQIQFGGRVWTLVFTALPRLEAGSFGPAAGTLLAGVVISALLFALTSLEARARSRAEELVQELQRTVDENARLLRDLQEVDRRKDQFLAVLGHELRNPLAPVVTALEVLRRDPGAAERQLPVVERQTRHMVRIVDDLLDVSRISRGKIELRKQSLSVRDALTRAFEAVAPEARSRDQKLILSLPEEPLRIDADPVRLEQILGNLLTNAIKYTPPGGEVELAAREQSGALVVQVRDTGIGVPLEAQQTLFEPFVQVAGAKDYAKGGLGIGLALVKALVQLHGGSVSIASEGPGRGTTFTVSVPGVVRGETPPEVRPIAAAVRRGRVLVVDDNVDAAVTLADAVSMDGHEVRVAHEGEGALEMARAFSPDVVLLDIGLPGMDGYEVARKMRQMEQTREAFIVALTGFGQRSDRDRALREGFDEHLVKPAELDSVQAVLRRRLGPIQVEAVPAASDRSEPRAR